MRQGPKKATKVPPPDPYKSELADRIAKALKRYNAEARRGDEISQERLGELVAKRLKLDEPFRQATVSRWMNPSRPQAPDNPTLAIIADLLEVDLMWLTYGATED